MDLSSKQDVLFRDTERSGFIVNNIDLQIIATRFAFVEAFCHGVDLVEFGPGSILGKERLIDISRSYTAVELHSDNARALQKELNGRGCVLNEDCLASSLQNSSCDIIIALAMVYYVDMENLLKETLRLLKPGGKLVFCMPNKFQPNFQAAPGSIQYYTPKEIERFCKFNNIDMQLFGAYSFENKTIRNNILKLNFGAGTVRFLLKTLKAFSPKLYLYLRSLKFGTVMSIPQKLSEVQEYDTPKKIDVKSDNYYRMFYFVLGKPSS